MVKAGVKTILQDVNFNFEKGKIYALMGPNGSGKTTLAYAIMGHPEYHLDSKSTIKMGTQNLLDLKTDKRARMGIFLSFQAPMSVSGVTPLQLLRVALSGKKDPLKIKNEMELYASKLKIPQELLYRSLNQGSSGGEKKKLELLQMAVLDPKFVIFDEIDTGVDIDSLKIIANFIRNYRKERTYLLITHYNRILK